MLKNRVFSKNTLEGCSRLLDDGRIRNSVDDEIHTVCNRMSKREIKAGKGLAPTRWYGQREDARFMFCLINARDMDIFPRMVYRRVIAGKLLHIIMKRIAHLHESQALIATRLRTNSVHDRLGIQEICVNKAAVKHPYEESRTKSFLLIATFTTQKPWNLMTHIIDVGELDELLVASVILDFRIKTPSKGLTALSILDSIWKSAMMARDCIRKQFAPRTIAAYK